MWRWKYVYIVLTTRAFFWFLSAFSSLVSFPSQFSHRFIHYYVLFIYFWNPAYCHISLTIVYAENKSILLLSSLLIIDIFLFGTLSLCYYFHCFLARSLSCLSLSHSLSLSVFLSLILSFSLSLSLSLSLTHTLFPHPIPFSVC